MRIAIVTLPLHTNYGGLLQAFALKAYLESRGHDATVLDLKDKMPLPAWWKAPAVYAKRTMVRMIKGSSAPEVFRELRYRRELPAVSARTSEFVDRYISPRVLRSYSEIREGEYDAFIVGSDQVWRPLYFGRIEDAFLQFTKGWDVRRLSYAASFGTDKLEYEYLQLEECARLLEGFDAVSVREEAGVDMCSEWLDCDRAVQVLDPVFLPDRKVYVDMASSVVSSGSKGQILTYILDEAPEKSRVMEFMKRVSGCDVHDVSVKPYDRKLPLQDRVVPSMESWLAAFRDAAYVVTDSFHGCVMAILFHKPFVAVGNSMRGMSRMQSLLGGLELDARLVQGIDPEDDGEFFMSQPDWEKTEALLEARRASSMAFLNDNLK